LLAGIFVVKKIFCSFVVCFLAVFADQAHAGVVCPPGTYSRIASHEVPDYSFCSPVEDDGDDSDTDSSDMQAPPASEPQWEERWGAIATGEGAYGAGLSFATEQAAINRAMSECTAHTKGKPCRVRQTFHNQCAALAGGDAGSIAWTSGEVAAAKQKAVAACSQHTKNCAVLYSGCSYPERVQ
jgi:hypothetical protein